MIREVIRFLRSQGLTLPLNSSLSSHILLAVSGGPDSLALAHLLIRYGRRVAPRESLRILHVNHGWRGAESDADERLVRDFAKKMGVPISVKRCKPPIDTGRSLEELAREHRKSFFEKMARKYDGQVFTAHHGDDLAETVLWRIMTGALKTHGGGISFRHGCELRPFLTLRKDDIYAYLNEEGLSWSVDRTNHEGRFLRSRIRLELLPVLKSVFPQAAEHLMKIGFDAQRELPVENSAANVLLQIAETQGQIRTRRAHRKMVQSKAAEIHLPEGWKLTCERRNGRWVLEKGK
jgi:tRNA(Ile)-lysidine synthase